MFSKDLDAKKKVSVTQFNGKTLVDIREYYSDKATGEQKPGKKGISLSEDAWRVLMESRDDVAAALAQLGNSAEPVSKKRKTEKALTSSEPNKAANRDEAKDAKVKEEVESA